MTKPIYTKADNEQLNTSIDRMLAQSRDPRSGYPENIQALDQIRSLGDAYVLPIKAEGVVANVDEKKDSAEEMLNYLNSFKTVDEVQRMSSSNISTSDDAPVVTAPEKTYFIGVKGGKIVLPIDYTIFEPSKIALLGGKKFVEKYVAQLESILFTDKDQLDPDKLIHIIRMGEFIKNDQLPITVTTGKYRQTLPKIVAGLNLFFKKNFDVIQGILKMFQGQSSIPQQPTGVDAIDRLQ